ncbi:hypothetical protein N7532_008063 [Penicillium argentinense]|uniref:tRNA (adenine(58)-N(1))-methyltransferase catalytic subunit TRM61 n=1 Tax=Penicillium argentinense TaxID=1131581 RepID=A0A9W9EWW4_9EURO|nr:uncharacterized protein N7532_008063 [Penicillium argentinense]KAJ5089379.1 hypothetical protein N7532_008063 [Penicillium argentinense]
MARLLQSLRRVLGSPPAVGSAGPHARSFDTDFSIFREGDRIVLHNKQPILTKPLKRGDKTNLRRGHLEHDRVIGSRVWETVQAHKGPDVRPSLPTLDEYVALTPRHVTPIYPHDANLIVSLLDLHPNTPAAGEEGPPSIEILESGTGHGSLTLHLARAIHAANTTPPPRPVKSQIQFLEDRAKRPGEEDSEDVGGTDAVSGVDTVQEEWNAWRAQRNAVIHTVDVSSKFSKLAEKNVQGFRRGMYSGDVDFYVGPVENWVAEQMKRRTKSGVLSSLTLQRSMEPFLSHAILDMPSAQLRIPHVAPIIKRDGFLIVFVPSITQIGDCVRLIRQHHLPLVQERVVELGMGISGGRQWDVRLAIKKSGADPSSWNTTSEADEASADEPEDVSEAPVTEAPAKENEQVMVCRPKVGLRTMGGGFVGIWRRIEDLPSR